MDYSLSLGIGCVRGTGRHQHDTPAWFIADGDGVNTFDLVDGVVHDLSICRIHRLKPSFGPALQHSSGELANVRLERLPATLAIAAHIHPHPRAAYAGQPALKHGLGNLLECDHVAATRSDEQPECLVLALEIHLEAVVVCCNGHRLGIDAECADQAIQELLHHGLLFRC